MIRRHEKTIFNLVYRMLGDYDEAAETSPSDEHILAVIAERFGQIVAVLERMDARFSRIERELEKAGFILRNAGINGERAGDRQDADRLRAIAAHHEIALAKPKSLNSKAVRYMYRAVVMPAYSMPPLPPVRMKGSSKSCRPPINVRVTPKYIMGRN